MNLLAVTWDGAGNFPPILALSRALVAHGHRLSVLAHAVQQDAIEAAGAAYIPYPTARQWDAGSRMLLEEGDVGALLGELDAGVGQDAPAIIEHLRPDAVLIDCMLPTALSKSRSAGHPTVALVHSVYSFWSEFAGGAYQGPIDAADLAIALTYRAFDAGARHPPNLIFAGPARPDLAAPLRPRRFAERPLVLASLSTGLQSPTQVELLQRICDALAALPVEGLVTSGRGVDPAALRPGSNTVVERLIPHDAVLPAASLLITHGGHGTVMAGLRYGAPMLALPPFADQPFNAARVVDLGLGLTLDPGSSTGEIGKAIERILADSAMRERSQAFAARVALEPDLEAAVQAITRLAGG